MVKVRKYIAPTQTIDESRSSGITALIALGVLEQMQEQGLAKNLLEMEHNSPEYLHALIEALRRVLETLVH